MLKQPAGIADDGAQLEPDRLKMGLDPLAAEGVALGPQLGMDARRAISFPMASMNALDIAQEPTIGDLARALWP